MEHWSADVRYWDTDLTTGCPLQDLTAMHAGGTLKAVF
jgi:hypothetical protein